jgi:hypothetical protein
VVSLDPHVSSLRYHKSIGFLTFPNLKIGMVVKKRQGIEHKEKNKWIRMVCNSTFGNDGLLLKIDIPRKK